MNINQNKAVKGFTLIELLIVIAIVAILSVVVILTLNPAELLKQTRDSNRISDMSTLKSALSLYLADVTTPVLAPSYTTCYFSVATTTIGAGCGWLSSSTYVTANGSSSRNVNGTGWLPVNFTSISSGAPVGNLPVDPVNNANYYYAYAASSTNLTFEIDAKMESTKYSSGGGSDVGGTDGGNQPAIYEVGTAGGLVL